MTAPVTEAAFLVRQSGELNLAPKVLVGGAQGFTFLQFMVAAGEDSESVFSVDLWGPRLPYAGAQKYFDDYVFRFLSSTNYYGAEAYASIQVIADALKRANIIDSPRSPACPARNRFANGVRTRPLRLGGEENSAELYTHFPRPVARRNVGNGMA